MIGLGLSGAELPLFAGNKIKRQWQILVANPSWPSNLPERDNSEFSFCIGIVNSLYSIQCYIGTAEEGVVDKGVFLSTA
jgi:hypothetical protein